MKFWSVDSDFDFTIDSLCDSNIMFYYYDIVWTLTHRHRHPTATPPYTQSKSNK